MKKITILVLIITSMIFLSGCGKFQDISIHGMKDVKLRGMKDGRILLNITLDIENPNNRKITLSKIYFKAWMNNRELGALKNSEKIVLMPNSRKEHQIPVEIVLRTTGDIFKLMSLKGDILKQITVEGFIKGRTLCLSKKVKVEKQPFSKLVNAYKGSVVSKDTIQAEDIKVQNDTLIVK